MVHKIFDRFKVVFDPNKKIANKGEVLVGLGNTQIENRGLVLQHKTVKKYYASLSQYVFDLDFNDTLDHNDTFFIEDYSVDTVLSVWLFLYKTIYKGSTEDIDLWLNYASRWERGDTSTTGEAFVSYGCLQNALALSMKHLDPTEILAQSLSFLDHLINQHINPSNINKDLQISTYKNAYLSLQKEYDKYEKLIANSEIEILYISKIESADLRKVSGVFIETDIVTSIQKVFLRNDKENSPTKDGFGFMAIYNPKAMGTGNDIVISTDPQKPIQLQKLWMALEKEEYKLWNEQRPNDSPRPLVSYPDNNGPNEPWWDDMGKYTLIASPKKIDDQYGRRVSWKTVKALTKQLYTKGLKNDRTRDN